MPVKNSEFLSWPGSAPSLCFKLSFKLSFKFLWQPGKSSSMLTHASAKQVLYRRVGKNRLLT